MKELYFRQFASIFEDADKAFREDVSYAVAVAKAARTIAAKRRMWDERRAELEKLDKEDKSE